MYSTTILVLITAVFILQIAIEGFTQLFWFNPVTIATQPWGFFTSIFLHGSLTHLFFNGFALFMFGPFLEQRIGSRRFLELFVAAGLAGSLFYYLFILAGITLPLPALGASGAIYGILGALAVLTPNLMIFMMFVPMPMRYAALLWVAIEFLGTFNPASGIASAAHLGGLFLGFAYAKFLVKNRQY